MNNGVAMDIDFLGADGGRLALAFAAGCAAAWVFLSTVWTAPLRARIKDLEAAREADRKQCAEETQALRDHVRQLHTMLIVNTTGKLRSDLQAALAEMQLQVRQVEREAGK